ncbi:MAG: GNAT family N-acetyltransferase [Bacillota bacterium]
MIIRRYVEHDETGWVRCRVLSFLNTAYFDNVLKSKEHYGNPSIELIAEADNMIVGLLDIECDTNEIRVCSERPGLGGMIWHIAVHPDYRNRGIASALLNKGVELCKERGIERLEAWTRDDDWVTRWYENRGFNIIDSYLHVFLDGGKDFRKSIECKIPGMMFVQGFAHYVGNEPDRIVNMFSRVHRCQLYELLIT